MATILKLCSKCATGNILPKSLRDTWHKITISSIKLRLACFIYELKTILNIINVYI